ncbi:MAG: ABC transporter permease [Propionibacteriaceae bacterium]|nr:ABC transporter permease [Propionibacteriaceae bacterium]
MSTINLQPDSAHVVLRPRTWKLPIALSIFTVATLAMFLSTPRRAISRIVIDTGNSHWGVASWNLPAFYVILLLIVGMACVTVFAWWMTFTRTEALGKVRVGTLLGVAYGALFISAFLIWAVADKSGTLPVTSLLKGALFCSIPLIFGGMAGTVCERVGVINVSIEGQLLAGAFLAGAVGAWTKNPWIGLVTAPIAGALVGALLALFAVKYWVDHIVVGVVLNVLVLGVTTYFYSTILTKYAVFSVAVKLPTWKIPLVSKIPVLGPVLFDQGVLVYVMYVAVIILQIMLFKSKWGLRLRSCGEHPRAADTMGIKVNRTRVRNTILGGAIAGLGGAYFTVAEGLSFNGGMSGGRGFIALAVMILGGWKPSRIVLAALLFGFADQLAKTLQSAGVDIPGQFMSMAPYLITIFAVAGLVGRVHPPAMEGKPYKG